MIGWLTGRALPPLNPPGEPPRAEVTEVHELESFEGVGNLQPGFSFYLEEIPAPS